MLDLSTALTPDGFTPDPDRLTAAVTYLESRAVTAELAAARGIKLVTPARAKQLAHVFPMSEETIFEGTLFEAPLFAPDGTKLDLPQLRRIAADVSGWVGEKFAMPRGMSTAGTINPVAAGLLSDKDWTPRFVVVEGLAKGDAVQAVEPRALVMAFTGVNMPVVARGDSIGPRPGDLLAAKRGLFNGASVEIVFDGDSATKATVAQATDKAAALYAAAGADVAITTIPTTETDTGCGPDDYLAKAEDRAAAWAARPKQSYAEWRKTAIDRKLIDRVRPRIVRDAQWLPAHMAGWTASTIAKAAFSVPVSTDGDAIYDAQGHKLGTVLFDEAGRPGVGTKDEARPVSLRAALREAGRPYKFFFEKVIPASLLDQLSPSTEPSDFDTLVAWLGGSDMPTPPTPDAPLAVRAVEGDMREIVLVSEAGKTLIYTVGEGLRTESERIDGRATDAERTVVREQLTQGWVAFSRSIQQRATISPAGKVLVDPAAVSPGEVCSIESNGRIYDLDGVVPYGRASSTPDIGLILRAARAQKVPGVMDIADPTPARTADLRRAHTVLSSGAGQSLIADRIEWTEQGLVTPLGRLRADGTFDDSARAEVTEPSALAIGEVLQAGIEVGASLPTEEIREWVTACFPGNVTLGYALIAAMIGAPLAGLCSMIPTIWIQGKPGAGKSMAAKSAHNFVYGTTLDASATGPYMIAATDAGVRKTHSQLGPFGSVMDDVRRSDAGGDAMSWSALSELMGEIIGTRYDQQRRVQATGAYETSVWPIVTAEPKLEEGSRIGRLLFFFVEVGQVDVEKLMTLPSIAPRFWGWLAQFAGRTPADLRDLFETHRDAHTQGRTDRLSKSIGAIAAGLSLAGLDDVIPAVEAGIREQHGESAANVLPSQRLIDGMAGLLSSGRAHVVLGDLHPTGTRFLKTDARQLGPLGWRVDTVGSEGVETLVPRSRTELGALSADRKHVLVPTSTMRSLVAQAAGLVERGTYSADRITQMLADEVAPDSMRKSGFIPSAYLPEGVRLRGYVIPLEKLDITPPVSLDDQRIRAPGAPLAPVARIAPPPPAPPVAQYPPFYTPAGA